MSAGSRSAASLPLQGAMPLKVTAGGTALAARSVAEETPVALVYDGSTHAVMMASPIDLADFALGFSLTEGVISRPEQIASLDIVEHGCGIELRMWLAADVGRAHAQRRRAMVGPTACGLCGIESLEGALKSPRRIDAEVLWSPRQVRAAVQSLTPMQALNQMTGAVHGAAFWRPEGGLIRIREDVGRHNALDKLAGALARDGLDPSHGIVVLTSRVSVEMVQKAAAMGAAVIAAISAPTALAVRTAEAAGITLVAVARRDAFEIFTQSHRIAARTASDTWQLGEAQTYAS